MSCLGKLFATISNVRLTEFCDDKFVLREMQAGFRQRYCTTDHVFVIKSLIALFQFKKKKFYCLCAGYRKASNLVWRDALWYKLIKVKIDGKILKFIRNMYSNTKSCVSDNQELSHYLISYPGVRQGENLSSHLFSLYVNDIEEQLLMNNCNYVTIGDKWIDDMLKILVLMYADDTVELADSEAGIANAPKAMEIYCDKWRLAKHQM